MSAIVSLPFRYPGTSLPLPLRDRFSLEGSQHFTRFQMPSGTDVVALTDGFLAIRPASPTGLPAALILRPLLPHRLTDALPQAYAAARLLGVEQIIYTGLDLRIVSQTACYNWRGTTRGELRRVVRRGVRTLVPVNPDRFLEGRETIRIGRGNLLFRAPASEPDRAFEFQLAVGLTPGNEPYLGDIMALLAWWYEAGVISSDPPIPADLIGASPPRLLVIGPRSGDTSFTFDCAETFVKLRRPPSDATLIPPELVRIGGATPLRLTVNPPPSPGDALVGELSERRGTPIFAIRRTPERPTEFTFDPLNWDSLPSNFRTRSHVDLEVVREPGAGISGIGIRAFRPPPNPRGQGRIEPRHPEENVGYNVIGFYEQSDATPDWDGWSMQVHAAGLGVIVWLQTRSPFRRFQFYGETTNRERDPVEFTLSGTQIQPELPNNVTAQLQFSSISTGFSALLTLHGRSINLVRVSTRGRLSDDVIDAISPSQLQNVLAAQQRIPLTQAQIRSCRQLSETVIQHITTYFQNVANRTAQRVAAAQIGTAINNWFNTVPVPQPSPDPERPNKDQPLLARLLFANLLAERILTFPNGRSSADAWLLSILDEVNDADAARPHLGLPDRRRTRFKYRWKFLSLLGPERQLSRRLPIGVSGRAGTMQIDRLDPTNDRVMWTQVYSIVVGSVFVGASIGTPSIGEADLAWNYLIQDQGGPNSEWAPSDFVGMLAITSLDLTVPWFHTQTLVARAAFLSNTRRTVISGPADGPSMNYGIQIGGQVQARLVSILPIGVNPRGPTDGLERFFTPGMIERAFPRRSTVLDFETAEARLNADGWSALRNFVALYLLGLCNPTTSITIIGQASRRGSDIDNQILSERRAENARRAMEDILGPPPRAYIADVSALGERDDPNPDGSNEPAERVVRIIVNGTEVLRLD